MKRKADVIAEGWVEYLSDEKNAAALVAQDAAGGVKLRQGAAPPGKRYVRGKLLPISEAEALSIPRPLSRVGRKAAILIRNFLVDHDCYVGGCKTFYTPEEWGARGEPYGGDSELVLVFDGGDLHAIMQGEGLMTKWHEELHLQLEEIGLYWEFGHSWNAALYPSH